VPLLVMSALALIGCNSDHANRPPPNQDGSTPVLVTDGSVRINPQFTECPDLVVTASPRTARPGGTINLVARVSGGDPAKQFFVQWTASVGAVATADAAATATTYTCAGADRASPVRITASVTDAGCAVSRTVMVNCLGAADAGADGASPADAAPTTDGGDSGGGGSNAGAGGTGGAVMGTGGGGGSCQGDPSECEGAACNDCTFGPNGNCFEGTDGCAGLSSDADRQLCWALYLCLRDQTFEGRGCFSPNRSLTTDEPGLVCWCGSAHLGQSQCQTGVEAANGPCLQQVIAAAKSSDPTIINLRTIDPSYPIGRALNLASCRWNYCGALAPDYSSPGKIPPCSLW
jgi:hypothetical protein